MSFNNAPAFFYALDKENTVPGVGTVPVDVTYGGQWYVIAQAKDLNITVGTSNGDHLINLGKRTKEAVLAPRIPAHPENPAICGINNIIISRPLINQEGKTSVRHTVIVTPGRLDRSPRSTGSSSRLAVLHARGQTDVGESFIGTEFVGRIRGLDKVGDLDAVLRTIRGRAWITGERQVRLYPDDSFQTSFLI